MYHLILFFHYFDLMYLMFYSCLFVSISFAIDIDFVIFIDVYPLPERLLKSLLLKAIFRKIVLKKTFSAYLACSWAAEFSEPNSGRSILESSKLNHFLPVTI